MSADQLIADEAAAGCRLDAWLSDNFEELSRSYLQKLIRDGNVLIGDKPVKSNYRLKGGEQISLELPEPEPLDVEPEPIPLDIVYEDSDLLFVNKPKGMVVHPAPGHPRGTLVGTELSGINGVQRPGIVHRIDRDTTGLLVVCKNDFSHSHVAKQLAEHTITRRYRAIVHGVIEEEEGTVNQPIGRSRTNRLKMAVDPVHGKQAVTHYRVLKRFSHYTYIECRLETGRTHQIRAHMTYLQHPLLGDPLYGARKSPYSLEGQTLHAGVLGLIHPRTGEYLEREAPLPEYFQKLLEILP